MRRSAPARVLLGAAALGASALIAVPGLARVGGDAGAGLSVIPFPGTPDASPASTVIFSSLSPRELRFVRVTGARSGWHAGHLVALPAGAGTVFVPRRRFLPGEQVLVKAGTLSGGQLRFSFGVAVQGAVQAAAVIHRRRHHIGPTMRFHSEPWLHPPGVHLTRDGDISSGDIFLAPNKSPQNGVLILNGRGQLVWFRAVGPSVFNFQVQSYHGQPVLTWWQGRVLPGADNSRGKDVIVNRAYRTLAVVHAGNGYSANLHEFQLTRRGTALLNVTVPVQTDLSSVGGPSNGTVDDDVIQEVDIHTGRVLWEWHALGHVPLDASYESAGGSSPYDYFHLNSIQQLPDGNLLISARNTWAAYKINARTGRVMWTLGGKFSSFQMGPGTGFSWQHDVRQQGHLVSLFDDAWSGAGSRPAQSSAKLLRLSHQRVTLVHRYVHRPPLLAYVMGSAQLLPGGKVFVGWGSESYFSEYSSGGRQILNGSFALGVVSYRAQRSPWAAHPAGPPSLAVSSLSHGHLTAWVSWNGATDVAAWRVMGGTSRTHLRWLAKKADRRFETTFSLMRPPRYVMVQALDGAGRVLGSSRIAAVSG